MALFHGEYLLLPPGIVFLVGALALVFIYNKVEFVYSKHVFQLLVPISVFLLTLCGLFFTAIALGNVL